jgi:hypothetical protein
MAKIDRQSTGPEALRYLVDAEKEEAVSPYDCPLCFMVAQAERFAECQSED